MKTRAGPWKAAMKTGGMKRESSQESRSKPCGRGPGGWREGRASVGVEVRPRWADAALHPPTAAHPLAAAHLRQQYGRPTAATTQALPAHQGGDAPHSDHGDAVCRVVREASALISAAVLGAAAEAGHREGQREQLLGTRWGKQHHPASSVCGIRHDKHGQRRQGPQVQTHACHSSNQVRHPTAAACAALRLCGRVARSSQRCAGGYQIGIAQHVMHSQPDELEEPVQGGAADEGKVGHQAPHLRRQAAGKHDDNRQQQEQEGRVAGLAIRRTPRFMQRLCWPPGAPAAPLGRA